MKSHFYKDDILRFCHKGHFTADEIHAHISEKYPSASRSSIYRNIESMIESWELKKLEWVWKKAYFETHIGDHIHLIDMNSWAIHDVDIETIHIPDLPKNFKITSLDIKVYWEFLDTK